MPDQQSTQNSNPPQKQIFAEARGRYTYVDDQKVYHFSFPNTCSVIQNYDAISFMREELWKAIQENKKREQEEKKVKEEKKDTPSSQ